VRLEILIALNGAHDVAAMYGPVRAVFVVRSRHAASSSDTRYQPKLRQTVLCHQLYDTHRRFFTHGKIVTKFTKMATKTMQFNIDEVDMELFIGEVKLHPEIWNIADHDRTKKRVAWIEICRVFCEGFDEKDEREKNDICK